MELTKAEEQIMKILWEIGRGLIRQVVEAYDDPKPAYTTVATIMKILENKGFVDKTPVGNTNEYFPLISKQEYTSGFLKRFVGKYYSNSYKSLISSLSSNEKLTTKEIEEIIEIFQNQLKTGKDN
jgi:BlaI family transcriptional regulator, penicillinase repressor